MENKEALEGADLRKLDTFLKAKDEAKTLGNLYRTVTHEGHVKWVCIDHYRENYQEYTAKEFQIMLNSVEGTFDRNTGRVVVTLRSKVFAEKFYSALAKARSVYDLDIAFGWAYSKSDLEALEVALRPTRVSILRLNVLYFQSSLGVKLFSMSAQYGVFFRLQGLSNMRIVHIVLPEDFIIHPNFQLTPPSCLCRLSFESVGGKIGTKDLSAFFETLRTNSTLTILNLKSNSIGDSGARELSKALKDNSTLICLNLGYREFEFSVTKLLLLELGLISLSTSRDSTSNLISDKGAQALSEALMTNSTLITLNLSYNRIGDEGARVLSESLMTNSTLTALELSFNSIGSEGDQALSEVFEVNSTLTTLDLRNNSIGDKGAQAWSEALKTNSTLAVLQSNDKWDNS